MHALLLAALLTAPPKVIVPVPVIVTPAPVIVSPTPIPATPTPVIVTPVPVTDVAGYRLVLAPTDAGRAYRVYPGTVVALNLPGWYWTVTGNNRCVLKPLASVVYPYRFVARAGTTKLVVERAGVRLAYSFTVK